MSEVSLFCSYPLPLSSTQHCISSLSCSQKFPLYAAQPQVEVFLTGGASTRSLQRLLQPLQHISTAQTEH